MNEDELATKLQIDEHSRPRWAAMILR